MKPITKAICSGFATEVGVMLFAVLTGSYAAPIFTSALSESGFDIPGRLIHFPGHQLYWLLYNVLPWDLSWWSQLFWLFTFQAAFWSVLWLAFLRLRFRGK
jgi:hypothetical protein